MKPSERVSIVERNSHGTLVEYICFRELDSGRYWCWGTHAIQPEYVDSPQTLADVRAEQDHWLSESLLGLGSDYEGGEERETFETIEEAIAFVFPGFGT